MSKLFGLSGEAKARVYAAAVSDGVEPGAIIERLVIKYLPPVAESIEHRVTKPIEIGDYSDMTFGELLGDLTGAIDPGPCMTVRNPDLSHCT